MKTRITSKGKFQVLADDGRPEPMAPVFQTQRDADLWMARTTEWRDAEAENQAVRAPYTQAYAAVLAQPELRAMRQAIQEAYGEAREQSKLAAAAQRAAVRGMGQISCMGQDIGEARQGTADYQATNADAAWADYHRKFALYSEELQRRMVEAGIPVALFRSPVHAAV